MGDTAVRHIGGMLVALLANGARNSLDELVVRLDGGAQCDRISRRRTLQPRSGMLETIAATIVQALQRRRVVL